MSCTAGLPHISTAQGVIVFDGDSLTDPSFNPVAWPAMLMASMGATGITTHNVAASGRTVQDCITAGASDVDIYVPVSGDVKFVVLWAGINSIRTGVTPEATLAQTQAYCDARRAAGWDEVYVFPIMPASGGNIPVDFETNRLAYNALLDADWPNFADGKIDLGNMLLLPGANDSRVLFTSPGTHLTQLGQQLVASQARPQIEYHVSLAAS